MWCSQLRRLASKALCHALLARGLLPIMSLAARKRSHPEDHDAQRAQHNGAQHQEAHDEPNADAGRLAVLLHGVVAVSIVERRGAVVGLRRRLVIARAHLHLLDSFAPPDSFAPTANTAARGARREWLRVVLSRKP